MNEILCACGCGQPIPATDRRGRPRLVKKGHSRLTLCGVSCRVNGCELPVTNRKQQLCNKHYCRWRNHGDLAVMKRAPNRTGSLNSQGYRQIHFTHGAKREHILIAERALRRPLPKGAEVHHFNEDKADNRPENLIVCQDRAFHALLHRRARAYHACGHADWELCRGCGKWDAPTALVFDGRKIFHLACRNAHQRRAWQRRKERLAANAS